MVRERSGGMMDASAAGEEGGEACRAAADLGLHHHLSALVGGPIPARTTPELLTTTVTYWVSHSAHPPCSSVQLNFLSIVSRSGNDYMSNSLH